MMMKMKMLYRTMNAIKTVFVAGLMVCMLPQIADAQLIAYEGFDYPDGDLAVVATGALGGGTGWEPGVGWVHNVREGQETIVPFDSFVTTNLPDGWGYTDSQGNRLQTSGSALLKTNWSEEERNFDLSGVDPALLRASKVNPVIVPGPSTGPSAFGAGGAEIWFSFLGDGRDQPDGEGDMANLHLIDGVAGSEQPKVRLGRPNNLQPDNTFDGALGNTGWGIADAQTFQFGVSHSATGDSAFDKVFYVARIQFFDSGQPIPGDASNVFGDEVATVWINPDLGDTAPSEGSAAVTNQILQDFALMGIATNGNADTYYDELRFGLTYADVAPIAVGQAGDFDDDLDVDGADFLKWQRDLGDATSLAAWEDNFGTAAGVSAASTVPEPSSLLLACTLAVATFAVGRGEKSHVTQYFTFIRSQASQVVS